jgi:BirA family biotin operon repressor/biotin-[acetyl-CoA-carboxylase] ligase
MNTVELEGLLTTKRFGHRRIWFDEIDSTNAYAKAHVLKEPEGTLIWADSQTDGRGRWGKAWHSKPGQSLLFSIVIRPPAGLDASFLQLLGCLAVFEGIRKQTDLPILTRWPNDLYLFDKKLAGILAETVSRAHAVNGAVIGVGVNLLQGREDFPEVIRDKAISLAMAGIRDVKRITLLADILSFMEEEYDALLTAGQEPFLRRWAGKTA